MRRNGVGRIGRVAAGLCLLVASAVPLGCSAVYMNYPSIGNDAAVNDPNASPMPAVVARSVSAALREVPPDGPFVVNLPKETRRGTALDILESVGDGRAELAALRVSGLPAYHVRRVWVRGSRARVEVLAPVGDGSSGHDVVVVRLESRSGGRWRVTDTQRWAGDAEDVPPLYGWPGAAGDGGDDDASE